jgi:hypothetical protein
MAVRRDTTLSKASPDSNTIAGISHSAANPGWLDQMPATANTAVNTISA